MTAWSGNSFTPDWSSIYQQIRSPLNVRATPLTAAAPQQMPDLGAIMNPVSPGQQRRQERLDRIAARHPTVSINAIPTAKPVPGASPAAAAGGK